MRLLIFTAGSRGDVQPFVALGERLRARGHTVRLCTAARFRGFVEESGVEFAPMNDELLQLQEDPEVRRTIEGGGGGLKLLKRVGPMMRAALDDCSAAIDPNADAVIFHPKALAGYHIAEKLHRPGFLAIHGPLFTPTAEFPCYLVPDLHLGGWYNRITYAAVRFATAPYASMVNDWRKTALGLPSRGRFASDLVDPEGHPTRVLYCYSEQLIPTPADWDDSTVVTGYWFLERGGGWTPPPALAAFLEGGPAPIYIGFGSMRGEDPERTSQIVLDAVVKSGQRAVIGSGWGGLVAETCPPEVFIIERAPHDALFPLMAGVVHHGGAGTTAAGLKAGRPTLICPFGLDQPFWGKRVHAAGLGPAPITQRDLTVDGLAAALRELATDEDTAARCQAVGEAIRKEDGVGKAIDVIEADVSAWDATHG